MIQEIRHKRLHAFLESKVLNVLMIVVIISLLQLGVTESYIMPIICAAIAVSLFLGYSLWIWIRKPSAIIINSRISNANCFYTIYYLAIAAFRPESTWWSTVPLYIAILLLFLHLINPKDESYEIDK